MEITVNDVQKRVEIWLNHAGQEDFAAHESLKQLYAHYKNIKYLVVVYRSGRRDLYSSTLDLLLSNRLKKAEG